MKRFLIGLITGVLLSIATGVASFLFLGSWLATEDALVKSDAIVAISGDTGARTDTAVALWKDGWAPLIIFSGAAIDPESVSSAEIMRREAVRQGVPESATLIEPNSTPVASAARVDGVLTRACAPRSRAAQLSRARSAVECGPLVATRADAIADAARAREARRCHPVRRSLSAYHSFTCP